MYNYYRQNGAPSTLTSQSLPSSNSQNTLSKESEDIPTNITELYHAEIANLQLYKRLLELAPNVEYEEGLQDIVDHTDNNLMYLRQIYLGLTGNTLKDLEIQNEVNKDISYDELLKASMLSKLDTIDRYEALYRAVTPVPYKDILFEVIIKQLKDATILNYLIATSK